MLFGYTSPDFVNRYPKETQSDGTHMYNGSWVKRMENFEEIKDKSNTSFAGNLCQS